MLPSDFRNRPLKGKSTEAKTPPDPSSRILAAHNVIAVSRSYAPRYAMGIVLILVVLAASYIEPGFLDPGNLEIILTQNTPVGLVAIGMTFVFIAGGFDLSVSAVFAAGAVVAAEQAGKTSLTLAILSGVATGVVAGLVNGLVITRLNVNPFVATLGSSSVISGLAILYSNSQPVVPGASGWSALGTGEIGGIPIAILILVVVFLLGWLVLSRTVYGRSLQAVGGNLEAARLAGLRIQLLRTSTYLLTGALAALAGIVTASQTGVAQADMGASITLDSIAIVIIGGTSLYGGEGAMWRTGVGLLILGTMNNVFDSIGVSVAAQSLVKGILVILAVALDSYSRRGRA